MSYNILVTEEAELDIAEISQWYEQQKQGLSKQFLLSVREVFKLLEKNPFIYIKVYNEIRRALTKKFPYQLFYKIDDNEKLVTIFAVLHSSRDDKTRKKRLEE